MTAQRRRLDRTAWLTTIPLVALILGELWTWLAPTSPDA